MKDFMKKMNCWEFNKCGREPDGENVAEFGVCPAATFELADGFCGGVNGGRVCSFISKLFYLDCNEARRLSLKDVLIDKKTTWCEGCGFYEVLYDESNGEFSMSNFMEYISMRENASQVAITESEMQTITQEVEAM